MSERAIAVTAEDRAEHSAEIRELCLELWMGRAGRNAEAVARYLGSEEFGKYAIPGRTISYWAKHENWASLADERQRQFAPLLRGRIEPKALSIVDIGMERLARIVSGDIAVQERDWLAALRLACEIGGFVGRSAAAQQVIVQTIPAPSPRFTGMPSANRDQLADSLGSLPDLPASIAS